MGNIKSRGKVQGTQSNIDKFKSREIEVKSIKDVPNEVIQKNIMTYLSKDDVISFGKTGNKRFKVIAEDELEKKRK